MNMPDCNQVQFTATEDLDNSVVVLHSTDQGLVTAMIIARKEVAIEDIKGQPFFRGRDEILNTDKR